MELKKGNDQLSVIPTIIVIVCTSFFPSFPRPWLNVCAGNCSVTSQHLIQVFGGGGIGGYLTKEKGGLKGLKWTTVKLYNLPNYFVQRCSSSESSGDLSNDLGKVESNFFGFASMCFPNKGMFSFLHREFKNIQKGRLRNKIQSNYTLKWSFLCVLIDFDQS